MFLNGKKFFWSFDGKRLLVDGFEQSRIELELGYWRKHPNLHGFIVNTFANGVDECQEIELDEENIQTIIDAINTKDLPKTTGFFFGESDGSEDKESIEILTKALEWLKTKEPNVSRSVVYRASW